MKNKTLLFELLLAFMLAFVIIKNYFSGEKKFDQLALGTETTMYLAVDENNQLIHISRINFYEQTQLTNAYTARGQKDVILFLGNSQSHSINQKKQNEVNFIKILYDSLRNTKTEILCHSLPNANLQEFCLSYFYWKDRLKLKALVIPAFFDDLREDGIREVFFPKTVADHFLLKDSSKRIAQKINKELESHWPPLAQFTKEKNAVNKNTAVKIFANGGKTTQESIEANLNSWLEKNVNVWQNRENVRGDFFVWIYQLRNTLLRIKASSVRKIIPQRYQDNMEALQYMIADCVKNKIKVLLYIPPIRSDVQLPYEANAYSAFKTEIEDISRVNQKKVLFSDFSTIVPGYLWGYQSSTNLLDKREIDYMHFKFRGHQILADSLFNQLKYLQ